MLPILRVSVVRSLLSRVAAHRLSTQTNRVEYPALEKAFSLFEERCQRNERVSEKDFIRTFDTLTRATEQNDPTNISLYSAMLLRCCGKPMSDTPPKGRELLAGNLWEFIKTKNIPIDISHYNSLIRVLNENETKFDPEKILNEIASKNLVPDRITYQRLIHQYCLQGDIKGATSLLEKMKDLGMELNEMTFSSLIVGYGKQENPPSIEELFQLMRSNNVEPGSKSYVAAFVSLANRFKQDQTKVAQELKKTYELLEQDEIQFSTAEVIDLITHLAPLKKSDELVDKILDKTSKALYGSISSRYRILGALCKVDQYEEMAKLFWSQNISEKALQTGNVGVYYIQVLAKHHNVPVDFALSECEKMKEMGYNTRAFHHLYYYAAESGRLELVRAALKKISQDEPTKVQYCWPLIAQAKNEEELLNTLKNDLKQYSDPNDLLETFSSWVWPKYSDNVSKLFELNKELNYDNNMLMASFLNYSVQENRVEEAIKFISEAPVELVNESTDQQEGGDDEVGEPFINPRNRTTERGDLVARLLTQISDQTKDPALVKKVFNLCKLPAQQISTRSLAALVRVHMLNNDFKSALDEFVRISREFRLTPCKTALMNHCLINKDPENLQKVMNIMSDIHGEANSLFDLAVCCLWCGKLKQAQKIFASPGFRVRPSRVYQTCRLISKQGDVNVLENFVNLARDMYDVNQEYLYQVLIDLYERTSNAKRALHLWNMMQEEEFQPSKKSLIMIANVLERNNIEVPFQKPRITMSKQ